MGRKSSWRRKYSKAAAVGIIYIPEPEPEVRPVPAAGSACPKCLACSWMQTGLCPGLPDYWGPWCRKESQNRGGRKCR